MTLETLLQSLEINDRRFVSVPPFARDLPADEDALLRAYLGAGLKLTDYPELNRQIWSESSAGLRERLAAIESAEAGADILNWLVPWQVFREVTRPHRAALRERFADVHGILGLNDELGRRAVYRSTSEGYTLDPLGTLDRGYGRCGELSVALTGLYRAKGLIARQVYVPYWAHQDDNHAWVEVKTDDWHFIGAAEPELSLDRGWFEVAASRAPLVVARAVFRPPGKPWPKLFDGGYAVIHNAPYFKACDLRLTLRGDGALLPDQPVYLQLLNEGRQRTLLAVNAERDGTLRLSLNAGDYRLATLHRNELYERPLELTGDTVLDWEITKDPVTESHFVKGEQKAPRLQARKRRENRSENQRTAHKTSCNKSYERRRKREREALDRTIDELALPCVPQEKVPVFKEALREMHLGAVPWIERLEGQMPGKKEDLIDTFLAFSDKERFYRRTFFDAPSQEERLPDHQGQLILQRMDPQREELWHTVRQLPATTEALEALRPELRWDPHRYRLQRTYRKQNGDVLYAVYCGHGHRLPESAELLRQLALEVPSETRDLLRQPASRELLSYLPEDSGILVFHGSGEAHYRLKAELERLRARDLPLPIIERESTPPESIVREAYLEPGEAPYVFYILDGELLRAKSGFSIGTDQQILDLTADLFDTFEG